MSLRTEIHIVCDERGIEGQPFLYRPKPGDPWQLHGSTGIGKLRDGQHACSKEHAQALNAKDPKEKP